MRVNSAYGGGFNRLDQATGGLRYFWSKDEGRRLCVIVGGVRRVVGGSHQSDDMTLVVIKSRLVGDGAGIR